jgi:predicted aconitase
VPDLELTPDEGYMLDGREGEAVATAMRILTRAAAAMEAPRLIPISSAHIDGCLYHGRAGLDFAERLAEAGGRVAVPTTLNTGSLDLLHPELYRGDDESRRAATRLMDAYVAMGCEPTWTCAPYQLPVRPAVGEQIAWAESNAIVFANSVLGARTERYGDFLDICAALTGRAPDAGLHRAEHRRGRLVFDCASLSPGLLRSDVLYPVLGHLVGKETGASIPVLLGLPTDTSEDRLKALGAAAASSGSVAMFHAVGVTPEAPTLQAALGGGEPERGVEVTAERIRAARDDLTTAGDGRLDAVSVGTPHFSVEELSALVGLLDGRRIADGIEFYVSTHRQALQEVSRLGWAERLERAGVRLVVDTCTYITPILGPGTRVVMTNSGKWAYYAPGNLGVDVVFGSLEECVRSAEAGRVIRDDALWS